MLKTFVGWSPVDLLGGLAQVPSFPRVDVSDTPSQNLHTPEQVRALAAKKKGTINKINAHLTVVPTIIRLNLRVES